MTATVKPLTAAERKELVRLSDLWAQMKATAKQIQRCRDLERRKQAADREATAQQHEEADAACGRAWVCACAACRTVRGTT